MARRQLESGWQKQFLHLESKSFKLEFLAWDDRAMKKSVLFAAWLYANEEMSVRYIPDREKFP